MSEYATAAAKVIAMQHTVEEDAVVELALDLLANVLRREADGYVVVFKSTYDRFSHDYAAFTNALVDRDRQLITARRYKEE